jgi:hypothetical protein
VFLLGLERITTVQRIVENIRIGWMQAFFQIQTGNFMNIIEEFFLMQNKKG